MTAHVLISGTLRARAAYFESGQAFCHGDNPRKGRRTRPIGLRISPGTGLQRANSIKEAPGVAWIEVLSKRLDGGPLCAVGQPLYTEIGASGPIESDDTFVLATYPMKAITINRKDDRVVSQFEIS